MVERQPKELTAWASKLVPIKAPTELNNYNIPAKIAK